MRAGFLAFALLLSAGAPARAAPPAAGSEDALIMRDFADWVKAQHGPDGRWCCDISDGRPLHDDEVRHDGRDVVVFVSRAHWMNAPVPGVWMRVPDSARIPSANPVGVPIAWFYAGRVWCFIDGNGS